MGVTDRANVKVAVIVSGRNSATTLQECLESLLSQDFPIEEIFYFDNGSSDDSIQLARDIADRSSIRIHVIDGGADGTISRAYNRGVAAAKSEIVVLCHSDCKIASPYELEKLVAPLISDPAIAVCYPKQLMPRDVWAKFPFWQKFLFALAVDRQESSMCATFDAVRRNFYMENGGFNEKRFTATCGYGGEDSEAHFRFAKAARYALTEARAVHLHAFNSRFGFRSYIGTRAMLARTYGKILRWQGGLRKTSDIALLVRPLLCIMPFCALLFFAIATPYIGLCMTLSVFGVQVLFSILASRKMFAYKETLCDWRILLVIPVALFMIYFETFWFFHGLLTPYADEGTETT